MLVPCENDAGILSRRRSGPTRGIKPRKRNCYCQLLFFPVLTRYRVRGSLILPPISPSKPDHPHKLNESKRPATDNKHFSGRWRIISAGSEAPAESPDQNPALSYCPVYHGAAYPYRGQAVSSYGHPSNKPLTVRGCIPGA